MARFEIHHEPSGDWAEADSLAAARLACRTLLEDNGREGISRAWERVGAKMYPMMEVTVGGFQEMLGVTTKTYEEVCGEVDGDDESA